MVQSCGHGTGPEVISWLLGDCIHSSGEDPDRCDGGCAWAALRRGETVDKMRRGKDDKNQADDGGGFKGGECNAATARRVKESTITTAARFGGR